MIVREAGTKDFEGIIKLYQQLNPDDPIIEDGEDRVLFEHIRQANNLHLFVLEQDGEVVSTAYLNVIPNLTRNLSPYAFIENVVTDSDNRNQGFGKQLIQHVKTFAWEQKCYKIIIQTGSKKEATHAFYRSCGFIAGERFAFVAKPLPP